MCEPMTMAGIAIGLAAVSGGVQAYGQYQAAKTEEDVANANAQLATDQAARSLQQGAAEAGRVRTQGTQLIAEQRVALEGSGTDATSGNAPNLFDTTRALNELDAATIRSNAAGQAWGHQVSATQARAQAGLAKRRSILGPLATTIGTGSQIAGMYGAAGSNPAGVGRTGADAARMPSTFD